MLLPGFIYTEWSVRCTGQEFYRGTPGNCRTSKWKYRGSLCILPWCAFLGNLYYFAVCRNFEKFLYWFFFGCCNHKISKWKNTDKKISTTTCCHPQCVQRIAWKNTIELVKIAVETRGALRQLLKLLTSLPWRAIREIHASLKIQWRWMIICEQRFSNSCNSFSGQTMQLQLFKTCFLRNAKW
jgi:hypothetical protein